MRTLNRDEDQTLACRADAGDLWAEPFPSVRLQQFLRDHLLNEVIPFWEANGPDPEGGFNTCLREDGRLINRDKFLWSQWRAVWVFARLHGSFGPRSQWLDIAEQTAAFALRHGWDEQAQGWRWRVSAEGHVLDGYESIYADGFAMYGLGELFRVTGNPEYERWARRTADAVMVKLRQSHDRIPHAPYPVPPGASVHGIPMLFSLKFAELGDLLGEPMYLEVARALHREVFERFYRHEWDLMVERVAEKGGLYPGPEGRAVVPGHVIEDMWFQIHCARILGDPDCVGKALPLIRRHLEFGWDDQYGGLFLARDAEGQQPVGWLFADLKLWWPHTEALYACLLAWKEMRADWAQEWYQRIFDYSLRHFYMPSVGEWRQRLARNNQPYEGTVALPVKDPFHLPRSLILQVELLDTSAEKPLYHVRSGGGYVS